MANSWPTGVQQLGTFSGTELIDVYNGGAQSLLAPVTALAEYVIGSLSPEGPQFLSTYDTISGSVTLAPSLIAAAAIECDLSILGALGAAATITLPAVASLISAFPGYLPGDTERLRVINATTGGFALTLASGTGWTEVGTNSIATATWRDFNITIASGTLAVISNAGGGNII